MSKLISLLLTIAFSTTPALAELYKWVGADGKITYSDTPPPADAKKVEKKRLNDRVNQGDGLDFATRNAMKKYPVVLFTTDCGAPCDQGRALLNKRGVPFTEKNPEKNLADGQELKKLTGTLEVPDLRVGKDTPIKGFNEAVWNSALDNAGYPKNAAPLKAGATTEIKDDGKLKSNNDETAKSNSTNNTASDSKQNSTANKLSNGKPNEKPLP